MTRWLLDVLWTAAAAVVIGFCVIAFLAFAVALAYLWARLGWT